MRLWLALLALLGLLLTPVAASAVAPACMQHAQPAAMAASTAHAGGQHDCCPEPGKPKPAKHDSTACANACALMCAGVAALPAAATVLVKPDRGPRLAVLAPEEARAPPPSLPERPPRHLA